MAHAARDQKLDALLSAAAKVFASQGFHRTSMRDLAKASGISLAGLYYYVQSKDELLYLIQSRNFDAVIAGMEESLEGVTDPIERLARFIDNHLDYFASHMAEMKVLSHEAEALEGDYLEQVNEKKRAYTRSLMDILAEVERTHGPAHANRRMAAYLLFGMMNWIYTWYDPLGDLGVELLGQTVCRLFLGGYVGLPVSEAALPRSGAG
ncbi:MAG TPA: TetR/AcrR family transcriptional regulator [Gemmatimonadaceae bacterium]|jgi:AcrR family transcriptional regulator|nr:TetR/AcrR family transcriptional regulator [Gemmatimonadaceae bacterium]